MQPGAKIDPEDLLLFSVELQNLTLTDGLAAYGDPNDPLIPIGDLTRLLEYDVDVEPGRERIVGRLGESQTSLIVDLGTGTARVGAKNIPFTAKDVAVTPTEIYLRASLVDRLLPLTLKVNHEALDIVIVPKALIPVQARLQRLARDRMAATRTNAQEELLRLPSPYHWITPPSFDIGLTVGAGSGALSQGPQYPTRYDLRMAGDLAFMGYEAYLGSDEAGKPATARITLSRRSVEGHLLGPLHAREISAGDVFTPGLPVGPRSLGGRGFVISTVPLDQTNIFNRIDLRGELPIGYDVELYINDVLQGGQNTPTKGRYEFLDVPLSRGVNVIRIVTYGPHGERSEETRVVNVGGGQLAPGEATFEAGVVQQEESVVNLTDPTSTSFVSPGAGGLRAVAALNYGLTQLITVTAGAALVPMTRTSSRGEFTAGARTSLFGFSTQFDVAADSQGGMAEGVGLAGQLFGVSSVLRYLQFQNGFIDENGPGVDFTKPLSSRAELSLDGNAEVLGRVVPLSFRTAMDAYARGETDVTGSIRGSATAASILFSGGFDLTRSFGLGASPTRLSGFIAGSTFRNFAWQIRSSLDYDLLPDFKPRALAVTVDHDLSQKASLRFGVGEQLDAFKSFNLTASAILRSRFGDLSLNSDYNNADQSWQLGAQVNFGLAYNPGKGRYAVVRQGPGTGGSVAFHAFIDANGNGRFDPGEKGVANVVIEGGDGKVVTDANGRAFVTGLGDSPTARLNVSLDKLDNQSMKTPPRIIQLSPRPGQVLDVDFPMQPTGEVMVRLLLKRPDGAFVGISGIHARLVGAQGKVTEANTEFDGSASFENLTAGTYHLELDPEQAARLRMHIVKPLTVTIKGDGGFTPDASTEIAFDPRPQGSQ
ncbi:MAG: hypothetical protein KGO51_16830 [Alphaproteobacteria bacterium]|nr:hypothetical protein [Alphaproteobacteria bacterium]